ncbi:hypothetical protein EX30DRAFT_344332 [Ascodesmis nigricans]|uniref:Uncharacterized protein n=1 Tax=Ascodesmis nigricans TaxID=341454 RepID=A0A4S2MJZ2_9PEZI|nr:hypothetical protein EX30DRAFT_344332 [Ascodesmis nigricans]
MLHLLLIAFRISLISATPLSQPTESDSTVSVSESSTNSSQLTINNVFDQLNVTAVDVEVQLAELQELQNEPGSQSMAFMGGTPVCQTNRDLMPNFDYYMEARRLVVAQKYVTVQCPQCAVAGRYYYFPPGGYRTKSAIIYYCQQHTPAPATGSTIQNSSAF